MYKSLLTRLNLSYKKPDALEWDAWEDWRVETKTAMPVKYFLNETLPDEVSYWWKRFTDLYNEPRYWFRCRYLDRYWAIDTGLSRGRYHDCDTRLLHGMFNLLVDFIEVEKAWMHVVFDEEAQKKHKHPWWSLGWTRFKAFRDPAAGLAHLDWEMKLGDPVEHEYPSPDQAHAAKEQFELYIWWKARPSRPDPMDASGWSAICDELRTKNGRMSFKSDDPEMEARKSESIKRMTEIEETYELEDQEMMIRLIKIRRHLWT